MKGARPVITVCGTPVYAALDDDRPDTLLVSDLHVPARGGAVLDDFIALLARARAVAERTRLLVLGDLLESVVNERQLVLGAWPGLLAELRATTDAGVRVTLLHGNRDFMLGARFARVTGCRVLAGGLACQLAGRRTLALHGDELCTNDKPYQRSKRWLRSWWLRRFLAAMPLRVAGGIGRRARVESNKSVAQGDQHRFAPVEAAVRAVFAAGFETLIFGHVHTPAQGEFAGGRYLILPAFDASPVFLAQAAPGDLRFVRLDAQPAPAYGALAFAPARG